MPTENKAKYPELNLSQLDSLPADLKVEAKEAINAKLRVIGSLRQRTNYKAKQVNIDKLTDAIFDKLLVIEYGLDGLADAKKELDELKKD